MSETTVWPILSSRDAPAAIRFLGEAFGCTELRSFETDAGA